MPPFRQDGGGQVLQLLLPAVAAGDGGQAAILKG